jgi:hypothetical protein
MGTYTYDERVKVCQGMQTIGAATCPRCGSVVDEHRMPSMQDRLLKRPGKVVYRCRNRSCATECTPITDATAVPLPKAQKPA